MEHHSTAGAGAGAGLAGTNFLRVVEFYENIHLKLISEALLLLGSTNTWVALFRIIIGRKFANQENGKIGKVRKNIQVKKTDSDICTWKEVTRYATESYHYRASTLLQGYKVSQFHIFQSTNFSCDDGNVVHLKKYFKIFCATQVSPIPSEIFFSSVSESSSAGNKFVLTRRIRAGPLRRQQGITLSYDGINIFDTPTN